MPRRTALVILDPVTYPRAYIHLVAVQRYLGVSRKTLLKWHEADLLPIVRVGTVRRIRREDLVAFLSRQDVRPPAA